MRPQEEPDFSHAVVEFFLEPYENARINKRLSEEQGKAVREQKEKVRYRFRGDKLHIPEFYAHEVSQYRGPDGNRLTHAELHPTLYSAFRQDKEQIQEGTPLEVMPGITPHEMSLLKAQHIFTVESLANAEGPMLKKIGMASRDLKDKAVEYLERTKTNAGVNALQAENEELKKRLEALEQAQSAPAKPMNNTPVGDPEGDQTGEVTPFDDWDDNTIKAYLDDAGVKYQPNTGRTKLIEKAVEHANALED